MKTVKHDKGFVRLRHLTSIYKRVLPKTQRYSGQVMIVCGEKEYERAVKSEAKADALIAKVQKFIDDLEDVGQDDEGYDETVSDFCIDNGEGQCFTVTYQDNGMYELKIDDSETNQQLSFLCGELTTGQLTNWRPVR